MQKLDIQYFFGPGAFFAHYPTSHVWLRRRKICAILQLLSCASTVTLSSFPSLRSVPQGLRVVASPCRNVILTTFVLVALSAVPASRLKTDRSPFPTPVSQGWFPCAEAVRVVGFSMVKAQLTQQRRWSRRHRDGASCPTPTAIRKNPILHPNSPLKVIWRDMEGGPKWV
jgi:hypothetical protein